MLEFTLIFASIFVDDVPILEAKEHWNGKSTIFRTKIFKLINVNIQKVCPISVFFTKLSKHWFNFFARFAPCSGKSHDRFLITLNNILKIHGCGKKIGG